MTLLFLTAVMIVTTRQVFDSARFPESRHFPVQTENLLEVAFGELTGVIQRVIFTIPPSSSVNRMPSTTIPEVTADERTDNAAFLNDRRRRNIPVATDRRRALNAAEKRRTSERRRLIDPTTCERDYTDEETDFMKAMDRYKRDNRRPFPTWSEVLEVMRSLGYRLVAEPTDLPGKKPGVIANVDVPAKG